MENIPKYNKKKCLLCGMQNDFTDDNGFCPAFVMKSALEIQDENKGDDWLHYHETVQCPRCYEENGHHLVFRKVGDKYFPESEFMRQ